MRFGKIYPASFFSAITRRAGEVAKIRRPYLNNGVALIQKEEMRCTRVLLVYKGIQKLATSSGAIRS